MDRQTVYSGQVPRTLDMLLSQQNAMVALAKLSAGTLGTNTVVNGFQCTPTTPATLDVILTAGEIYEIENLEQTTWSAVPQDTADSILKQGILLEPVTMAVTPPTTTGYSQIYLLEVSYSDVDTGNIVLPYFNAANPQAPFSGPGNAGTAQSTMRRGEVAFQLKAGIAAPTGTQTAPSADPGWTGLFLITVAQGQTTVTAGNIQSIIGLPPGLPTQQPPYIPVTLPQVPIGVQSGMWCYGVDVSTTMNQIVVNDLNPQVVQLYPGMCVRILIGSWAQQHSFTGTVTNTSPQITSVSSTTGLVVGQLLTGAGIPPNTVISSIAGTTINMSNNAISTPTPPVSIVAGGNIGTSSVTLNVGTGANNVVKATGAQLSAGDINNAGQVLEVCWDGSRWQVVNFFGQPEAFSATNTTVNNTFNNLTIPYTVDTSHTANTVTAPFNPAVVPVAGTLVIVQLSNTVTGPTVIQVNAQPNAAIVDSSLNQLTVNSAVAGEQMIMVYTGTQWQLVCTLPASGFAIPYTVDTSPTANTIVAPFNPAITSTKAGMLVMVKLANTVSGQTSIVVNSLPSAPVVTNGLSNLQAGSAIAGEVLLLIYTGTAWQLVCSIPNNGNNFAIPYVADTSPTPNTITAPFSPALTAAQAGQLVLVKLANTITGPTIIGVNSLPAAQVINSFLQQLQPNNAVAGEILLLVYNGVQWQLIGVIPGPAASSNEVVVVTANDVIGNSPGGTTVANWNVGYLVNSAGGFLSNLSLAVNMAANGPNGMDSGGLVPFGDVSVYIIYNPGSASVATLACNSTVSNGPVYTGGSLPAGYTSSVLLWAGRTDPGGNFNAFNQVDNDIYIFGMAPNIPGIPQSNTYEFVSAGSGYLDISPSVPVSAKTATGNCFSNSVSVGEGSPGSAITGWIAGSSNGIGAYPFYTSTVGIGGDVNNPTISLVTLGNFGPTPLTQGRNLYIYNGNGMQVTIAAYSI